MQTRDVSTAVTASSIRKAVEATELRSPTHSPSDDEVRIRVVRVGDVSSFRELASEVSISVTLFRLTNPLLWWCVVRRMSCVVCRASFRCFA